MNNQTFSLTFAESVENHRGMEIIGDIANEGWQMDELEHLANQFNGEMHILNQSPEHEPAMLVIFRNGLKTIFNIEHDDMFEEQNALKKDSKCFMYGRVVEKKARHNLCFADFNQEPDYEKGKGTIINFKDVNLLNSFRNKLGETFGKHFKNLYAEGNYYYDLEKTYIGEHGDTERKRVLCVRLGQTMPIYFRWFYKSEAVSEIMRFDVNGGDIYIMSEKAVGFDWKKKNIHTLRHSAGIWSLMEKKLIDDRIKKDEKKEMKKKSSQIVNDFKKMKVAELKEYLIKNINDFKTEQNNLNENFIKKCKKDTCLNIILKKE
jgi:hypothetical protein